jgi:hypothetical protein
VTPRDEDTAQPAGHEDATPIARKRIDAMIAGITPENDYIDRGWIDAPDVGEEIVEYPQLEPPDEPR